MIDRLTPVQEFQIVEGSGFDDLASKINHQEMRGWWREGGNVVHSTNGQRYYLQGMSRRHKMFESVTIHYSNSLGAGAIMKGQGGGAL